MISGIYIIPIATKGDNFSTEKQEQDIKQSIEDAFYSFDEIVLNTSHQVKQISLLVPGMLGKQNIEIISEFSSFLSLTEKRKSEIIRYCSYFSSHHRTA